MCVCVYILYCIYIVEEIVRCMQVLNHGCKKMQELDQRRLYVPLSLHRAAKHAMQRRTRNARSHVAVLVSVSMQMQMQAPRAEAEAPGRPGERRVDRPELKQTAGIRSGTRKAPAALCL